MSESENYYTTLGLNPNASSLEIKRAFRELSKQFHPDKNNGDADYERKFKQLQNAYEVLRDEERRKDYDIEMGFRSSKKYRVPSNTNKPQPYRPPQRTSPPKAAPAQSGNKPKRTSKQKRYENFIEPRDGIDHTTFLWRMLLLLAGSALVYFMLRFNPLIRSLGYLLNICIFFIGVVQVMKRLTHLGKSWWQLLFLLIPVLNWGFLIYLCFARPKGRR